MDIQMERNAITRLQGFAPKSGDSYYLCYSGGKDSDCIRILAQLAGVPFELHHNLTSVDAPETVRYVRSIPGVIIDYPRYGDGSRKTMWNLIPRKKIPPTRLLRYCCAELKEGGGKGRLKVTGVRWAESRARASRSSLVQIIGKPVTTQKYLADSQIDFSVSPLGGVVLNMDNAGSRRAVEHCYRTTSTLINPIIDWSDTDVWEFLHHYGCKSNPLYQCGDKRIGCIGCSLSTFRNMRRDFVRYPQYKRNYIAAFDRMLAVRSASGLSSSVGWRSGLDVFKWWIGDDPDQYSMFDDSEIQATLSEMGVYV